MNILIIGAGGMLGHDLVTAFAEHDVIVADLPEWDITNEQNLKSKLQGCKLDLVINSAAFTDVEGAEDKKDLAFAVNANGVLNLAKICNELDATLLHISTEYVFSGDKKEGYNEEDQTSSLNIYGQSKEQGEKYLVENCKKFYLIRSSWLFGRALQKGKPRGKNFIDKIIELGQNQEEVKVVNDQFGKPTFTKDLSQGIKSIVLNKELFGIYHLVNEGVTTWHDLAQEAFNLSGLSTKLLPVSSNDFPSKVKRPKFSILNNNKLPKLRPWQEAVKEYLL